MYIMSIIFEEDNSVFISSEKYFNSIVVTIAPNPPIINKTLFEITSPYTTKKPNRKKKRATAEPQLQNQSSNCDRSDTIILNAVCEVKQKFEQFKPLLVSKGIVGKPEPSLQSNKSALECADWIYEQTGKVLVTSILGCNLGPAVIKSLNNEKFIFPSNSQFYCKDVANIRTELDGLKFDLILLDPPWWNKYIRRKRKKCPHAYEMMFNCDLKEIPIETLLSSSGLVVVWCTNSSQHLNYLIKEIFPKWKVSFVAKWFWLKVTQNGDPVCEFSKPPGKQPFEHIIIGAREGYSQNFENCDGKLIVSVPSAIHSHKPPLVEMLTPLLPNKPACLEVFARYLLPNWTSYGNEVLRFQHESLYK